MLLAVVYKNHHVAVGLIIVVYLLDQFFESNSGFFSARSHLVNLSVLVLVVLGSFRSFALQGLAKREQVNAVFLSSSVFLYALITAVWASNDGWLIERTVSSLPYVLVYMLFASFVVRSLEDSEKSIIGVISIGAAVFVVLLSSGSLASGAIYNPYIESIYGDARQLNYLAVGQSAAYVALAAALGPLLFRSKLGVVISLFVVLAGIFISFQSGARGQTLMLVITLLLFLPFRSSKSLSKPISAILFGLLFLFLISGLVDYSSIINLEGTRWSASLAEAGGWRYQASADALTAWVDGAILYQFIGFGSGYLKLEFGYYPHVLVVELLVEQGIVGLALFLYILYRFSKASMYLIVSSAGKSRFRRSVLPYISFVFFTFGISFKQGTLFDWAELFLFGSILLAMEHGIRNNARKRTYKSA